MMSARCCFSPLLLPSLQALFRFETSAEAGAGCNWAATEVVGWLAVRAGMAGFGVRLVEVSGPW